MTDPDKRFEALCQITRAQHFAWREAVVRLCPGVDPVAVVDEMWRVTGRQTAEAYSRRIDPSQPMAPQVANCIAWSSWTMGEDAVAEEGGDGAATVRHSACPWFDWHRRLGLLPEDRPGCDAWFRATLDRLNEIHGSRLSFETLESLPEGGRCCLRKIRDAR